MKKFIQSEIDHLLEMISLIAADNALVLHSPLDVEMANYFQGRNVVCQSLPYAGSGDGSLASGDAALPADALETNGLLRHAVAFNYQQLPFANESMDLIVAPHLGELTPQTSLVLAHLRSIMSDEGSLVLSGFNRLNVLSTRWLRAFHASEQSKTLTLARTRQLLRDCGFRVVAAQYFYYEWWVPEKIPPVYRQRAGWISERWFARLAPGFILHCQKDFAQIHPWQKLVSPISRVMPAATTADSVQSRLSTE